jgi:YYY domain-containing protein
MLTSTKRIWIHYLLLVLVLVAAAYFRWISLNWDADQHLHPDERFLTMVETALQVKRCALPNTPLESCTPDQVRWLGLGDYLNTSASPLNPQNRGFGFFVYGDLPIVFVRYVAEWVGQVGYDQVNLVGRHISALSDLLTILLIYMIAARLYDRRVALLAAAFSALAVLQIQQSHFFTVDTVANLFIFLAVYFAVLVMLHQESGNEASDSEPAGDEQAGPQPREPWIRDHISTLARDRLLLLSLGFGASLGLAVASKLSAAPLAIVLPGAFFMRPLALRKSPRPQGSAAFTSAYRSPTQVSWSRPTVCLIAGAIAAALVFRIAQPYAFIGIGLNPAWVANINELRGITSGTVDVPFALQWARRSYLFSFTNLTVWGLGLPLGLLSWIGFIWMAWRIFKGELHHVVLWVWTAIYFGWQSLGSNPTMRYQLPSYPLLCLMAGWFLVYVWDAAKQLRGRSGPFLLRLASFLIGAIVLSLTLAWAYAFTRIYTRPVTRVAATRWVYQNVPGPINLRMQRADGTIYQQPVPIPTEALNTSGLPYAVTFRSNASGSLKEIYLAHAARNATNGEEASQTLSVSVGPSPGPSADRPTVAASVTSDFSPGPDGRGKDYTLTLDHPLAMIEGQNYSVSFVSSGPLTLVGAAPINESDWDDGLPLRLGPEGYDGFGGIYQGGLNLQIYWDDNADKLKRFVDTLSQGDILFMSSNRQWATVTRVPERYPLTTAYYRALIGCPAQKDVIWCYNVAKPGMFDGQLGYRLVAVFESFPTLEIPGILKWEVNDQFAEEAFTVYDHPKVLIFEKQADFSAAHVQQLLGAVDLTNVVHLTPKEAGGYKSLMLSPASLAQQQGGGTWSQLFNYDWIQNRYPAVGLIVWYLFIFGLGVLTYPIIRYSLPGLGDKGYPLARVLGLVLLGYFSWLSGSAGVSVTRATIGLIFAILAAAGLLLAWKQRKELAYEWKTRRNYFLMVEGLFLVFFAFDLLIRIGNPDLWHPSKGGERPMDFSYFNAVIKSTVFPPYDPWFAGGTINYYYYGFVLVAMPVKLLGIVPTLAYNLILPTLFAMVALGAFCAGWNLLDPDQEPGAAPDRESEIAAPRSERSAFDSRFLAGLFAALLMVVLGNLGTVRMIYQGLQRMAAPGGIIEDASIVQRLEWAAQGAGKTLGGESLPYGPGDWYWNPSRVIPSGPGNEITEFPFFTFLYSDLHAHMLAMPLALLALAWALSIVRSRRVRLDSLFLGGLVIGALYPTNLSDIYTYLPLGFAVLAYAVWRSDAGAHWQTGLPKWAAKLLLTLGSIVLLTALSYGLYEPYRAAYSQGYGSLDPWTDSHTPIWSYFAHWGVFLFIITCWLAWETRKWLASTPVSSLNKLRPYQSLVLACIAAFVLALLYLAYREVQVGWLALPLAAWAGVLMLRPGMPDMKRFALFLIGTALLITIVVEVEVVHGDIGRMNTIFKFYLQAWALLSVSAAAALVWLLADIRMWHPGWRNFFQAGTVVLLTGAAMYTIYGTIDKVSDRMATNVPLTLDSITYMQYAQYSDFGVKMDLAHDYHAIRWMQDHVQGSPVIVEANCPEYRWCTRFTIYTGLPGVVGWNWHQRQQRTLSPQRVEDRVSEISSFYATTNPAAARDFLRKYGVRYIIVGQLERAEYPGAGLDKFAQNDGRLWDSVYREGDTTIYEVRP